MLKTIAGVNSKPREHSGAKGLKHYVSGCFDDGTEWSVGCEPHESEGRIKELEKLIGQPGEFEFWGEPREYRGITQYTLNSWPGKAPKNGYGGGGGSRGGGGSWKESYSQSKECELARLRSIQRACSLERAIQTFGGISCTEQTDLVIRIAEDYFAWLSDPGTPRTPPASLMTTSAPQTNGSSNGHGITPPTPEVKPTQDYVRWESEAYTLASKHSDIWPTWQDALHFLKPQLVNMGLGSPRALKECNSAPKFATLLGALKNRAKQPVMAGRQPGEDDDGMPF